MLLVSLSLPSLLFTNVYYLDLCHNYVSIFVVFVVALIATVVGFFFIITNHGFVLFVSDFV